MKKVGKKTVWRRGKNHNKQAAYVGVAEEAAHSFLNKIGRPVVYGACGGMNSDVFKEYVSELPFVYPQKNLILQYLFCVLVFLYV